ncbi:hypothetical protein ABK905_22340 [Acerihabitans sp. KWT182]|uniref:Uncharacterized protein n=1 Tax=Acerihabitans sp. KWT182 TaxID=3157919 RepID=A0AAU7Q7N8_9GAMM
MKINNITGRAGRMLEHFSGNIYLIEPENWTYKDYFDEPADEVKIPTYFKLLNEDFDKIINALSGTYSHEEKDQYRYYAVANKLINEYSNDVLNNTLTAPEIQLNKTELEYLNKAVITAFQNLKISSFTLEANPTVGYIQQNRLFAFLSAQATLDTWLLPHPKSDELFQRLLQASEKTI